MYKRYDELKVGDIIDWYGAQERITKIETFPWTPNDWYPNEKVCVYFTIEPADAEAEKILGKFYSHGKYGGVGCLQVWVEE